MACSNMWYYLLVFAMALPFFKHYINDTLHKYLDTFCTAYLDNILIYSNSLYKHKRHVKIILEYLRNVGLFFDVTKCEFHIPEVPYLEFIISTYGVKMYPAKIKTILE